MEIRKAWLHRKGRKTWLFESSKDSGVMSHSTSKGGKYWIMQHSSKPYWIGKILTDGAIVTVEKELRGNYIEFENGGEYWFRH